MTKMEVKNPITNSHVPMCHIRRIYKEEKANVVAAVWGTEFIQFLAALQI